MSLPITCSDFVMPSGVTYLSGMSLGCLPKKTVQMVNEELDAWGCQGVEAHGPEHKYGRSWYCKFEKLCIPVMASLLGAHPDEVTIMGELSANLNMLFLQFYRPTKEKYRIVMEDTPFPSDKFIIEGVINRLNVSPDAIVYVRPNKDTGHINDSDIISLIQKDSSVAVVFLSAVQYYTGQFFDIERISAAARKAGALIALDLAHAVGNVPLRLSEWEIDFASWCSYKYLNSGPGSISGVYVNRKHLDSVPVFRGWWGCQKRFSGNYCPEIGAARFAMSNPGILSMSALYGSLCLFAQCDISDLRKRSYELCSLFRENVSHLMNRKKLFILTPSEHDRSGAQLTLTFPGNDVNLVFNRLRANGFVTDMRYEAIRIAFVALYNTTDDVLHLSKSLNDILECAVHDDQS